MSKTVQRVYPTLNEEKKLFKSGYQLVIGFDEVGRGALAGPVMVGAAAITITTLNTDIPQGLADSKMLTAKKRESLFYPLQEWSYAWAVGSATNQEIDAWGISYALGIAALRALNVIESHLIEQKQESLLSSVAGMLDGPIDYITPASMTINAPTVPILPSITTRVKGDMTCACISAASVLAKVTRDQLMEKYAQDHQYQAYHWDNNKGYGSAAHRQAITEQGPSNLHRLTWHLV